MRSLKVSNLIAVTIIAASSLSLAPKASALVADVQCTAPNNASLVVSGTDSTIQPPNACTTTLSAVSSNGFIAGDSVIPYPGYSPIYDPYGGGYYIPETETTTNNFVYDSQTGTSNVIPDSTYYNGIYPNNNILSVNSSGNYLTNGSNTGAITNTFNLYSASNASMSVMPSSMTSAIQVGDNNAVIGDTASNTGLYVPLTGAAVTINPTGLGASVAAVNATGQVVGTTTTNATSGTTAAFLTGSNASGATILGTANGVSSAATTVNSSGQVGGYITLASGQTETFITNARGGIFVGIGAGASTDSTTIVSLNVSGQAIVNDTTTGAQYFYSSGVIVPMSSIFTPTSSCSVGCAPSAAIAIDNYGQIVFSDPTLFTPNVADYSQSQLLALTGAVSLTSTSVYQAVAASQGSPTLSTSFTQNTPPQTSPPPASGVPAPLSLGLLGLGVALLLIRKRSALSGVFS